MSGALVHFNKRQNFEEFYHKAPVEVVAASTANIADIPNLDAGDTLDGVTLSANDLVLLKDQVATEENGVYEIGSTPGTTARSSLANTPALLDRFVVRTGEGKLVNPDSDNRRKFYYQTATIVNLEVDPVTWAETPNSFSFTVPGGVTSLKALMCGAGGAGAFSAATGSSNSGGDKGTNAGGGGAGGVVLEALIPVTPGQVLTVYPGKFSNHGRTNSYNSGVNGAASSNHVQAADGESSTITGTGVNAIAPGGEGGQGITNPGVGTFTEALGGSVATPLIAGLDVAPGGNSGQSSGDSGDNASHVTAYNSVLALGGTAGSDRTGGGAGGNSIGKGGDGGNSDNPGNNGESFGAGGGGAGSASEHTPPTNVNVRRGYDGGFGYCGYVRLSW